MPSVRRRGLRLALALCVAPPAGVLHGAEIAVSGESAPAQFSPQAVRGWANSISTVLGSPTPDFGALAPVFSSLKSADLGDPQTRAALAPVYAAVQSQVRPLLQAASAVPADPTLSEKYLALVSLGDFHPATRERVRELARACYSALPEIQKEEVRAKARTVLADMASVAEALGPPPTTGMRELEEAGTEPDSTVRGSFRNRRNPRFEESAGPLNFEQRHVDRLVEKMTVLQREPKSPLESRLAAMRLASVLAEIDRHYVDAISPAAWEAAFASMESAAVKAFAVEGKDWGEAVTAVLKAAVQGLLDPHSSYWNEKEWKSFQDAWTGTLTGVGVDLGQDGVVIDVAPGGPAEKAGIRRGDAVAAVDGDRRDGRERIAQALRGAEGAPVRVQIERGGQILPEVSLVRAQVKFRNVNSRLAAADVGYVQLGTFSPQSEDEVFSAVGRLRTQGARKLVLDLRGNPGGSADSVNSILASFFEDGQRLGSHRRRGELMWESVAVGSGRFRDMPLVVLIDGGSASASEFLAGAVQDVRGPFVVGSRSYGKGSKQTLLPDPEGRALRLTNGRWYTPLGRSVDARRSPDTKEKIEGTGGVVPDHLVALAPDREKALLLQLSRDLRGIPTDGPRMEDPALRKALELLADGRAQR